MWDIVEILLEIFSGTLIQFVLEMLGELAMRGAGNARFWAMAAAPWGPSHLSATFWGGGLFAFAMAVVRWWMVGR
jgi:hypothetical protein